MFTGIIEEVGEIVGIRETGDFRRLRILAPAVLTGAEPGASIATNGVCITVAAISDGHFEADLSSETLHRTTFGNARIGRKVNLERAMRADSRFGGHFVQGHVDGIGRVRRFDKGGDDWNLEIAVPPDSAERLVWKGSIAVDGISLTVAALHPDALSMAIIPFTMEHTNLGDRKPGDEVNLEFDILAKYVERLAAPYLQQLQKGQV